MLLNSVLGLVKVVSMGVVKFIVSRIVIIIFILGVVGFLLCGLWCKNSISVVYSVGIIVLLMLGISGRLILISGGRIR